MCGQMAIASENELNSLLSAGKSYLQTGRADTFEQMYAKVEAVTSADLMDVAAEIFAPDNLSTLIFKNRK